MIIGIDKRQEIDAQKLILSETRISIGLDKTCSLARIIAGIRSDRRLSRSYKMFEINLILMQLEFKI